MPRRPKKKFHYIYKTTCNVTGNYYVGMHSTDNLEDGYLGSGKRLMHSINKYGEENHTKKILEYLSSRAKLKEREAQIVNEELINDQLCMNLQLGGGGGFINEDHMKKCHMGSSIWISKKFKDKNYKKRIIKELHKNVAKAHKKGKYKHIYDNFSGKKHSKKTIDKIKESQNGKQKGFKNSQYGTCWITNGEESKKINKGDLIPEGWRLGRKIKK